MNEIYLIDYYSNNIRSLFHQRPALTKLFFLLLILLSIVISKSVFDLVLIFFTIIALIILAQLPFFKIFKWSLYPVFFALIFAVSQIKFGLLPLKTILKALDATLLMFFIFCTTPYPVFVSLILKISPILANTFFFTYRYFFLIISGIQTKFKVMRIRGGFSGGVLRTLKNIGLVIGSLFLSSIEKSQIVYEALIRRGFRGKFFIKESYQLKPFDFFFILMGLIIFIFSI